MRMLVALGAALSRACRWEMIRARDWEMLEEVTAWTWSVRAIICLVLEACRVRSMPSKSVGGRAMMGMGVASRTKEDTLGIVSIGALSIRDLALASGVARRGMIKEGGVDTGV